MIEIMIVLAFLVSYSNYIVAGLQTMAAMYREEQND